MDISWCNVLLSRHCLSFLKEDAAFNGANFGHQIQLPAYPP